MTNLQELIETFCPEGVRVQLLGDLALFRRGTTITKTSTIPGKVPVLSGGQKPAYFHGEANRHGQTVVVAGSGAYAGFVTFWEEPVFVSDAFTVEPKNAELDAKYLYYLLKSMQGEIHNLKQGSGIPHVYGKDLAKFKVQVPPLPVQQEIVRILDTFTQLEAELEAELEARRKQYEHYRNELLSFKHLGQGGGVTWVTFDDVIQYEQPTKYLVATKNYSPEFQTPVLTAGQTFILGYTDETHGIYEASDQNPVIIFDDFTCAIKFVDFPFKAKSSAMKMLTPKTNTIDLRFAYFVMQSLDFSPAEHARQWIGAFSKIKFPLPNLSDQRRIVESLNSFHVLVHGLRQGLPGEIEARRKQYEYYRQQLLTFDELV